MELNLQLFGGRGGGSGVATAGGSSMQDTYGQMAEAKGRKKNGFDHPVYGHITRETDGDLSSDMGGADLAQALYNEGAKPETMKEITDSFRRYARDLQDQQSRISHMSPMEIGYGGELETLHQIQGRAGFHMINKQGESLYLNGDMTPEQRSTARSWITRNKVAYISEISDTGTRDSMGLRSDGALDMSGRAITNSTPRTRIMQSVMHNQSGRDGTSYRRDYEDRVDSLFGANN